MSAERKTHECLDILRAITLAATYGKDPTADEMAYHTGYETAQVLEALLVLREHRLICSGAGTDRFHPTPLGRMLVKRAK
ncbi:MAG TPA: hypothetical protein VJ841_01020 [Candidatus Saccharimonadales bacterium]|nr:hypothetical protein [Candidatus Saccharimonadales bacterium]